MRLESAATVCDGLSVFYRWQLFVYGIEMPSFLRKRHLKWQIKHPNWTEISCTVDTLCVQMRLLCAVAERPDVRYLGVILHVLLSSHVYLFWLIHWSGTWSTHYKQGKVRKRSCHPREQSLKGHMLSKWQTNKCHFKMQMISAERHDLLGFFSSCCANIVFGGKAAPVKYSPHEYAAWLEPLILRRAIQKTH